jgi:multidrug efflux system membrane fusion protein
MKLMYALPLLFAWIAPVWALDVPAQLQWSQRVPLTTNVSGVVQSVHANVGERVKKGQVLAALDASGYQAQVAEAQAVIARSKEEQQDAKRNLDRVEELYKRTTISTSELETAQTRYARATAQLNEAQAHQRRTQKILGDATLRAPFDALVLERQAEPGQIVASQFQPQALFVIARAGEMIARAKVTLAQIEKLKAGDAVTVEVNKQSYSGKIKLLGLEPVGEKGDIGYPVDVIFAVKEVLRAGTPATLKLP